MPPFDVSSLKSLFRGGVGLAPRLGIDGLIECNTDMLRTDRETFLFGDPAQLERFGVAYTVRFIAEEFKPLQRGRNAAHDELMVPESMTIPGYSMDGC